MNQLGFVIPNHLLNVANSIATFCLYEETITNIGIGKSNINKSTLAIGKKTFINCFVEFNNYLLYTISVDLFLYNNVDIDDCAMAWDHAIIEPNRMPQ